MQERMRYERQKLKWILELRQDFHETRVEGSAGKCKQGRMSGFLYTH